MTLQTDTFLLMAETPQGRQVASDLRALRGSVETIGAALEGLIVQLVDLGLIPPDEPDLLSNRD